MYIKIAILSNSVIYFLGRLIRKLIKDMESVRSGSMDKNRKLMLYGAHDLNVVSVLKALGVFYPHVPKYSSAVIVELHLIDQAYYVQVYICFI